MTTAATENWTTSWTRKKANRWRAVALADSVASLMFKSFNRFAPFNCYAPFPAFERVECSQFIPPELRRSVERCQDKGINPERPTWCLRRICPEPTAQRLHNSWAAWPESTRPALSPFEECRSRIGCTFSFADGATTSLRDDFLPSRRLEPIDP